MARRVACGLWLAIGLLAPALSSPAPAPGHATPQAPQPTTIADAIEERLRGQQPGGSIGSPPRGDLDALYVPRRYAPLWLTPEGRPAADSTLALELLAAAAGDGLEPEDYGAESLARESAHLSGSRQQARFDVALTVAVLTYLQHLHHGRVDPRRLGLRLPPSPESHDVPALLAAGLRRHDLAGVGAQLRPPVAQYRLLQKALTRYRKLAVAPPVRLSMQRKSVRPGDPYAEVTELRRGLQILGDLPATAAIETGSPVFDKDSAAAVSRFQRRHGLVEDGVIGQATLAALTLPLAVRVRQIELALERLRWLPDVGSERLIAMNIPMFRLWAWDTPLPPDGTPLFSMDVIVGRALRSQTPVFVEEMREVILRPYWNVPASITRRELLPLLERDPEALRRQQIDIVRGDADHSPTVPFSAAALDGVRSGRLRLRQRPGPDNALGLIKFVFPNAENVYMHGTPAQQLFAQTRRDFSHGCVRVEDPLALAAWALRDTGWTRDRIAAATAGSTTVRVALPRPIQVVLFYTTAAVMPEDEAVYFADDIYRHDLRLQRALGAS